MKKKAEGEGEPETKVEDREKDAGQLPESAWEPSDITSREESLRTSPIPSPRPGASGEVGAEDRHPVGVDEDGELELAT